MARNDPQFKLNLPEAVLERVKEAARVSNRSVTAELVYRIENSFESHAALHADIARVLEQHIEDEILRRFRALSSQLGKTAS